LEREIHAYLRAINGRDRESERVGPFLATFSRRSPNPYVNYAIPDDDAEPAAADIEALTAAFRRRGRKPRLEYLPGAAPAVEPALLAHGYMPEGRLTVMAITSGAVHPCPVPAGFELLQPSTDDELLALKLAQNEAYGDPPPDDSAVERERAFLARGGLAVLARSASGEPAGGGECTAPEAGLRELAGVGVRERFRRQGLAQAITAALCQLAFGTGTTLVWLTPAGPAEERMYSRVGFRPIGEALHISQGES
jgi:GNAT superfamily N-acetyltransferase